MSDLEKLFFEIDKNVEKEKNEKSYLEGLSDYLILDDDEDYFNIVDNYSKEDIKKVYQFLILKGLKELNNPNYDITPEIIAVYVSQIINSIFGKKKLDICDLAAGSGNFLLNISEVVNKESKLISVDVEPIYVKLEQAIFNLLQKDISIINQDALKPLNIPLQDVIVCDSPAGYYADVDNSLNYKLCSNEGYSFNTLLFIEQAINYLKDNGIAILVVSNKLMELDDKFKKFLEADANLNAFISLPSDMFKNKEQQKAIVLLTKKGQKILPEQVFLGEIPSYQNKNQYVKFIEQFKSWTGSK